MENIWWKGLTKNQYPMFLRLENGQIRKVVDWVGTNRLGIPMYTFSLWGGIAPTVLREEQPATEEEYKMYLAK